MFVKVFVVFTIVCLMPAVLSKTKRYSKLQSTNLYRIRCDLMCFDKPKDVKAGCRSQCRQNQTKPGTCPASDTKNWEAACIESCTTDYQCDGTERCCYHYCGSTCSEPLDLLSVPGLPAMPKIEELKERKKSLVISWSDGVGDSARAVPGSVIYVLEEQHHLGPKYEEIRLEEWNPLLRTNKTKISLRNALKPGRWYRFRVAAVNSSGTRGFSNPSPPFTPRRGPRPPLSPKKLKARTLRVDNGTVTARLEWKEPNSDLPVMRYKVFWSRRVKGLSGELDSVLVNHRTVSKDQTHIDIDDLEPNSMYFLQVQTISKFGTGKLRSDKASIFYNTTIKSVPGPAELKRSDRPIKGLKLHKIIWDDNKLKARISWDPLPKIYEENGRYFVHWRAVKCNNPKKIRKQGWSAATQRTLFELYELDYQCSYRVNVNSSRTEKIPSSELTIVIPACEYFKRRINTANLNCESA